MCCLLLFFYSCYVFFYSWPFALISRVFIFQFLVVSQSSIYLDVCLIFIIYPPVFCFVCFRCTDAQLLRNRSTSFYLCFIFYAHFVAQMLGKMKHDEDKKNKISRKDVFPVWPLIEVLCAGVLILYFTINR